MTNETRRNATAKWVACQMADYDTAITALREAMIANTYADRIAMLSRAIADATGVEPIDVRVDAMSAPGMTR